MRVFWYWGGNIFAETRWLALSFDHMTWKLIVTTKGSKYIELTFLQKRQLDFDLWPVDFKSMGIVYILLVTIGAPHVIQKSYKVYPYTKYSWRNENLGFHITPPTHFLSEFLGCNRFITSIGCFRLFK